MIADKVLHLVLGVFVLGIVISFYRMHRNPNYDFNLLDLLMENGRVSRLACAFMVTLVVTSWIMLKLVIDKNMNEGYLIAYGGMWVAPIIAKMFATSNVSSESSSTTTTTSVKKKPLSPPPRVGRDD